MARRNGSRATVPIVVLILLIVTIGIGTIIVSPDSRAGRWIALIWGAVGVSSAIWQWTYHHVEAQRLRVNRASAWLRNPEVTWGLEVEYDVDDAREALASAQAILTGRTTPTDKLLSTSEHNLVAQLDGVTVRLEVDQSANELESTAVLRLDIPTSPRAWRGWKSFIDETVPPVLEDIDQAIAPSDRKYTVEIGFPKANPYFGLFVNQVPATSLIRFNLEYFEHPNRTGARIRVHSDKVQIVTNSPSSSRVLSLRYLTLQPTEEAA